MYKVASNEKSGESESEFFVPRVFEFDVLAL